MSDEKRRLVDGGHIYVQCSNCSAVLLDIFRTRPDAPTVSRLKALCPFCGDASFAVEVRGGFHIGGYGRPNPDNPEDDYPSTVVDPPDEVDGLFIFPVKKASPDAKPVRTAPR